MKVVIIGGVAAGASAAARLRRLDEAAEIILLEKGSHVSYANCGLPYHLGGVIPQRKSLLVVTPERFKRQFNVQVRIESEVVSIDRTAKNVTVRMRGGETYIESYDKLVLATGSSPVPLQIPGIESPRVTHLWTLADMDQALFHITAGAKRVALVGAGFVGLETAENLREKGLEVTVVQRSNHVLSTVDREMAVPLAKELESSGIRFEFERVVKKFITNESHLGVILDNGKQIKCDFAILCAGVKPNSDLARSVGLELGTHGHIVTDEYLRTSDPDIFAAGDAVEVRNPILGGRIAIPLAGPANKQGRLVADN
ncbi:MAG: CoA-disulfide reductase, partial [Verrucomicrobiae bacterium]|nr:CoA-disulfide reductase [Verrucomicrobiae bacterium]